MEIQKETGRDEIEKKEFLLQVVNQFARYNGVKVIDMTADHGEAELVIRDTSLNPYGTVHGGALFTMCDVCSGVAARSDGRAYVTENADISYLRAVSEGRLLAKSCVIHRGRTRCVVDVKVYDDQEHLICTGTFSFFCVDAVRR